MIAVVQLSAVATAVLRAIQDSILHEPHRALTVGELTETLGVDRLCVSASERNRVGIDAAGGQ